MTENIDKIGNTHFVELIIALEQGGIIIREIRCKEQTYYQGLHIVKDGDCRRIALLGWLSAICDPVIPFCQMVSYPNEWKIDDNSVFSHITV